MGARYQALKIEIYEILECPITQSVGAQEKESDNVIDDVWE